MRSHAILWVDVADVACALGRALHAAWRDATARRAAAAELRALDRAGLADLGITRDQIEDYVAGRLDLGRRARPQLRVIEGGAHCAAAA